MKFRVNSWGDPTANARTYLQSMGGPNRLPPTEHGNAKIVREQDAGGKGAETTFELVLIVGERPAANIRRYSG
jgi:hypothetical protein